ncbi:endoglucanase [Dokdonia sp. Dokd-P16]|uniref:glycoside hydrolase family 5 protein n=1 Tax=Dokdonia sp. Dokd-P16 TaxID=2173169 RepID=UPI000D542D53|nr:glycoside hydrolase family 5 protein [Dokdonia sp. Dokd-P16]AWH74313.1 endoglucanase [Dokdonia sp. Dokd-P16]
MKLHTYKYAVLLLLSIFALGCSNSEDPESSSQNPPEEETPVEAANIDIPGTVRDITSADLVSEMGIGWNLGNSLDVKDADKTLWGNPLPSQAIIDKVYSMGFRTLRVPVSWNWDMQSTAPYTVNEDFLTQVQETVNFGISKGMHVIIDVHHDEDWLRPTNAAAPMVKPRLASLWTQIANRFNTYGDKLIFETLNETRLLNSPEEWSGGTEEGRSVINEYHETALNAIRATGGNNARRHVMMSTYAASTLPVAMNALVVPDDSNIIISLHTYFPWPFTGEEGGTTEWGTDQEKAQLENEFEYIKNKWIVQEGRPVILGEWGAIDRSNLANREAYAQFYVEKSMERGLLPIVWDDGGNFRLLDRQNLDWHFPSIADIIVEAAN